MRVRVENLQHAGNCAVVDDVVGLVRSDGLGVVLFDDRVDVGEGLKAVAELAFVLRRLCADAALQYGAGHSTDGEENNEGKECAAGARSHR